MKAKKKIIMSITITLCAILLVVGSIAGTMAYLRATAEVVNTFTYGKVAITMDETLISSDGLTVASPSQRVTGNRYKLMPSTTYVKDPVIHVGKDSEEMYLFLKVDNGIAGLALTEEEKTEEKKTIHDQLLENGWKVYVTADDTPKEYKTTTKTATNSGVTITSTSTIYYLSKSADDATPRTVKGGVDTDIVTFTRFTTGTSPVTEASMTAYVNNNAKIGVLAFAVQASGFETYHDAAAVFATEFASAIPTN